MSDSNSDLAIRYAPELPLPPYSYVTGKFPHPERDPAGHGHHRQLPHALAFDPRQWLTEPVYLHAVDLFNGGYYWESHEAWETLWHIAGRRGTTADFLKGLIKLAAAGVKAREGRLEGVRRHAARGAELFSQVATAHDQPHYCGLDLSDLIDKARALQQNPPAGKDSAAPVEIVFAWRLLLQA
jgi:hypothetical protein